MRQFGYDVCFKALFGGGRVNATDVVWGSSAKWFHVDNNFQTYDRNNGAIYRVEFLAGDGTWKFDFSCELNAMQKNTLSQFCFH